MAKGFRRPERLATLAIDEGEYAGAEITVVTNPSWEVLRDLELFLEEDPAPEAPGPEATDAERALHAEALTEHRKVQREGFDAVVSLIAEHVLRGWNIVDHRDRPYPADAAGLAQQPPDFIGQLIGYWRPLISRVAPPLGTGSSAGEPTDSTPTAAKPTRRRS